MRADTAAAAGILREVDTVVGIDDSGSMTKFWNQVEELLGLIAPVCTKYDEDGIDVHFLNHRSADKGDAGAGQAPFGYYGLRSYQEIKALLTFTPRGLTPSVEHVDKILTYYIDAYEQAIRSGRNLKPLSYIFITDGVSTDKDDDENYNLKTIIVKHARRLQQLGAPKTQVGLQLFQIGRDKEVRKEFKMLDDDLKKEHGLDRDMVDTKSFEDLDKMGGFTPENIMAIVVGAICKRFDRMGA